MTLEEKIIQALGVRTKAISFSRLKQLLPGHTAFDIKCALWSLTAAGKATFDKNWKIKSANEGSYL